MQHGRYKTRLSVWLPLGLRRIDSYYAVSYCKAFVIIMAALAALVGIGDLFQRFDDFVQYSRDADKDFGEMVVLFFSYYFSFVPQLILQYMFPVAMLLAASLTAVSSYAGPRGNNEYIVVRSAGIPVLRALMPLILPTLLIALLFQAGRDAFLPYMIRNYTAIYENLRNRSGTPVSLSIVDDAGVQTAAIGWFAPDAVAHNLILEIRDVEKFNRGDARQGDNDFVAYRAAAARLERGPDGNFRWLPLEKAEIHTFTRYARRSRPWVDPLPTNMTPSMLERQAMGDAVSSWRELLFLREDSAGARFELNWRLADPLACCLLVLMGTSVCMWRMLRGSGASYIQTVAVSMLAAGCFYGLRLLGRSLWESGYLGPAGGVWLPILAAFLLTLPVIRRLEP